MRSRKINGNYRILIGDDRIPKEMDIKRTNKKLDKLESAVNDLRAAIAAFNDDDDFCIADIIMNRAGCSFSDGKIWQLEAMAHEIKEIKEELATNNDDVPSYEESIILEDIGFRCDFGIDNLYQKVLTDTEEIEIVEEVFLKNPPLHRKRTIEWEATDYGRSSKNIIYEDLPIDKNLKQVIENTQKYKKQ